VHRREIGIFEDLKMSKSTCGGTPSLPDTFHISQLGISGCLLPGETWETWNSQGLIFISEKSGNFRGILLRFRTFKKKIFLL